jgi:hypothetical protein
VIKITYVNAESVGWVRKVTGEKRILPKLRFKNIPNLVIEGIIQTLIVQGDNKPQTQDYSPWVSFLAFFPHKMDGLS